MAYVFADCELDCERRELRRNGSASPPRTAGFRCPRPPRQKPRPGRDQGRAAAGRLERSRGLRGRAHQPDQRSASRHRRYRRGPAADPHGAAPRLPVRWRRPRAGGGCWERCGGSAPSARRHERAPRQAVTFLRTSDGVHLAVASAGSGPPLVKTANWLNHLEFDWQSPVWSPLFQRLAGQCRLIRYDERGMGLSDRDVPDFSFEAWVRDLETVVDGLKLDRFALLGISQGAPISIAYAVRHPERVSRLILCGAFAKGWRKRGSAADVSAE